MAWSLRKAKKLKSKPTDALRYFNHCIVRPKDGDVTVFDGIEYAFVADNKEHNCGAIISPEVDFDEDLAKQNDYQIPG